MNAEGVRKAVEIYRRKFAELKIEPVHFPGNHFSCTSEERLAHCSEVLDEIKRSLNGNGVENAIRWLGFVQGCLWSAGIYTVDDLQSHGRDE